MKSHNYQSYCWFCWLCQKHLIKIRLPYWIMFPSILFCDAPLQGHTSPSLYKLWIINRSHAGDISPSHRWNFTKAKVVSFLKWVISLHLFAWSCFTPRNAVRLLSGCVSRHPTFLSVKLMTVKIKIPPFRPVSMMEQTPDGEVMKKSLQSCIINDQDI